MAGDRLAIADNLDVGIDFGNAVARRLDLGAAYVADAVQHLALEVGGIDLVEVDDAELPDAGRGQVDGGRAAQPAGADHEHLAVEQLDLPLFAELAKNGVAAVANELVFGEHGRHFEGMAGVLPAAEAADQRVDVAVAHLLQVAGRERRADAAGAVDHDRLVAVGLMLFDLQLKIAARHERGVGDVSLHPFIALADVDERQLLVGVEPPLDLVDGDFLDFAFGQLQQLVLVESRHNVSCSRRPWPAQSRFCRSRRQRLPALRGCGFRRRCGRR